MMCFRERRFCTFLECKNIKCDRRLTEEVSMAAKRWWGSDRAPIDVYAEMPECFEGENIGKKPVVIEAMQFTDESKDRCYNFVRGNSFPDFNDKGEPILKIQTLEGVMLTSLGDWIIKGVEGEFYPCKPDIFEKTYELVEEEET